MIRSLARLTGNRGLGRSTPDALRHTLYAGEAVSGKPSAVGYQQYCPLDFAPYPLSLDAMRSEARPALAEMRYVECR